MWEACAATSAKPGSAMQTRAVHCEGRRGTWVIARCGLDGKCISRDQISIQKSNARHTTSPLAADAMARGIGEAGARGHGGLEASLYSRVRGGGARGTSVTRGRGCGLTGEGPAVGRVGGQRWRERDEELGARREMMVWKCWLWHGCGGMCRSRLRRNSKEDDEDEKDNKGDKG